MRKRWIGSILSLLLFVSETNASEKQNEPLHLPKSTLLFGWSEIEYLVLTTPTSKVQLLPPPPKEVEIDSKSLAAFHRSPDQKQMVYALVWEDDYNSDHYVSLSPDGKMVAFVRPWETPSEQDTLLTYSIPDKKLIERAKADEILSVAISPDQSKIAFMGDLSKDERPENQIYIVDMKTGAINKVPSSPSIDESSLSWSADGKRLVYQDIVHVTRDGEDRPIWEITVIEIESGKITRLAEGRSPSWSPSGEWIAYVATPEDKKCIIVHPDGTDAQVVAEFHDALHSFHFVDPSPAWSPDSTQLLLNEYSTPKPLPPAIDHFSVPSTIWLVDITKRTKKKVGSDFPVLGWGSAN